LSDEPPGHDPPKFYRFAVVSGSPAVLHVARCRYPNRVATGGVVVFFDALGPAQALAQYVAGGVELASGVCLQGRWWELVRDEGCPLPSGAFPRPGAGPNQRQPNHGPSQRHPNLGPTQDDGSHAVEKSFRFPVPGRPR
jgi:hypothetical protein